MFKQLLYFIAFLVVVFTTEEGQICLVGDLTCTLQVQVTSELRFCTTATCTTLVTDSSSISIGQSIFILHYLTDEAFGGITPAVGSSTYDLTEKSEGYYINNQLLRLRGELEADYNEGDEGFTILTKKIGYSIYEFKQILAASGITIYQEGVLAQVTNNNRIIVEEQQKEYRVSTQIVLGDILDDNRGVIIVPQQDLHSVATGLQFCSSSLCTSEYTGSYKISINQSIFMIHYIAEGVFDGKKPFLGSIDFNLPGNPDNEEGFQIDDPVLSLQGDFEVIYYKEDSGFTVLEKKTGYSIYELKPGFEAEGVSIYAEGNLGQAAKNNRQIILTIMDKNFDLEAIKSVHFSEVWRYCWFLKVNVSTFILILSFIFQIQYIYSSVN